jgi:hypothetical protein
LFIVGLGTSLATDITLQQPATLNDTIMYTRAYEQHGVAPATTTPLQF